VKRRTLAQTAMGEAGDAQVFPVSKQEWLQLCEIMNGYIYSQTLVTACDLQLFTYLSRNHGATRDDLQRDLRLSGHCTRVLMLAACAVGLVRREAESGRYYNSQLAEKVLVAGSPHSMLPFVQFNYQVQQRGSRHLTKALKENRNAGLDEFPGSGTTLYHRLVGYPELEDLFQEAMGAYTRLSPQMLEFREFSEIRRLLDVGGGDGSNAIRLCRLFPQVRITILEIPTVVQIARGAVDRAGLADRIRCEEGDMFAHRWPAGHDAAMLSHVVEIFSQAKIRHLYAKAYESLPPKGKLFVWTIMANDAETAALQAAKSSIYFLCVASGEGMAYPAKEHEHLMKAVGFRSRGRLLSTSTQATPPWSSWPETRVARRSTTPTD
jgi:precorrin-6B methylase 2